MQEAIASFDFAVYLEKARTRVEDALDASLGPEKPEKLRESMFTHLLTNKESVPKTINETMFIIINRNTFYLVYIFHHPWVREP